MTTRERNLATILIAVVGVMGVAALANAVFLQPFNNLRGELEKADQSVAELLLQVIDNGRVEDSEGSLLDFRRAFLIFTTNAGVTYEVEVKKGA